MYIPHFRHVTLLILSDRNLPHLQMALCTTRILCMIPIFNRAYYAQISRIQFPEWIFIYQDISGELCELSFDIVKIRDNIERLIVSFRMLHVMRVMLLVVWRVPFSAACFSLGGCAHYWKRVEISPGVDRRVNMTIFAQGGTTSH